MNRDDDFRRLARAARDETAPPVDVTTRVMAAIATDARGAGAAARAARVEQRPLLLCTAGAVLAASVTMALAAHWWIVLDDPLTALLQSLELMNP